MVYLKDPQDLKTFESHSCNDNKKTHKFKLELCKQFKLFLCSNVVEFLRQSYYVNKVKRKPENSVWGDQID